MITIGTGSAAATYPCNACCVEVKRRTTGKSRSQNGFGRHVLSQTRLNKHYYYIDMIVTMDVTHWK